MSTAAGVFACPAGGMSLSPNMHAVLSERFPGPRPRPAGEATRRPARWFCPGCGVPLDPGLRCGRCGRTIGDLVFPLVELHPHAEG